MALNTETAVCSDESFTLDPDDYITNGQTGGTYVWTRSSLDVGLTNAIFDMETVRLSGRTDTFNTVDKIKNDLESSDYFKTAIISSAKLDRTGSKVEFEIKLERAS